MQKYNPSFSKYIKPKNSIFYVVEKGNKKFFVKERRYSTKEEHILNLRDIVREFYALKFMEYFNKIMLEKNKDREAYNYLKRIVFPKAYGIADDGKGKIIIVQDFLDYELKGGNVFKHFIELLEKGDYEKFLEDFSKLSKLLSGLFHFKKNRLLHNDFNPRNTLYDFSSLEGKIALIDNEMLSPLEILLYYSDGYIKRKLNLNESEREFLENLIKKENRNFLDSLVIGTAYLLRNNGINIPKDDIFMIKRYVINTFKDQYNKIRNIFENKKELNYNPIWQFEAYYLALKDLEKSDLFKEFNGVIIRENKNKTRIFLSALVKPY
jgi:hypothetical protein